jgi:hypothetical protein
MTDLEHAECLVIVPANHTRRMIVYPDVDMLECMIEFSRYGEDLIAC